MAIATNGLQIVRIAGAVFNQQLSAADYSEILTANKTAAELNAWANSAVAAEFKGKTTLDISKAVLANLGLTVTGLDAWLAGQLTAGGGVAKAGETMLGLLNDFSNMTADVTFGASASTFNAKAAGSQALSQSAGSSTGTYAAVSTAIPALTLTSATQTSNGTAGDDTFTAAAGTWGTGDIVNGGAGTDTLNATVSATGPTQSATSLVGVEVLNLTASPNPATLDLTGVAGLTEVNNNTSANGATLTVTGLGKVVNTTITGGNTSTSIAYATAAVAGTADAATLSLKGSAAGSSFTTSGVETLTINSGTAANNLTTLSAVGMTKLVVTGDQALTIVNAVGNNGTTTPTTATYDLSAATGALTLTTGNGAGGTAATGVTVTGPTAATAGALTLTTGSATGSANDTVTLGAGTNTVTTNSGNDTITSGGGANTITPGTGNDTINAGAGVDTIRLAGAGATDADTINAFGTTDVIAINLGSAAVTATTTVAAAPASANASFAVVPTGATSPVLQNVAGTATANAVVFQTAAPATSTANTIAQASNVISLNGVYTDGTATGVFNALGTTGAAGITTSAAGRFLLVTYSVGNTAQVWAYTGDSQSAGAPTDIDIAELSLVATLNGVALNGITAANFSTYLTPAAATAATVSNAGQTINLNTPLNTVTGTANAAGQFFTAAADTVNVSVGALPTAAATSTAGLTLVDATAGDADVLNATVLNAAWDAGTVLTQIETVNLNMLVADAALSMTTVMPGTTSLNVTGSQSLAGVTDIVSGTAFGLGADYTGTLTTTPAVAALTLNLNGTAGTSAATSPQYVATGTITALTINANATTTLKTQSATVLHNATGATLLGAGNVTYFGAAGAFDAGILNASGVGYTGALTVRPSDDGVMNFGTGGVVTGIRTIDLRDIAAYSSQITLAAANNSAAYGAGAVTVAFAPTASSALAALPITILGSGTTDALAVSLGANATGVTGAITALGFETLTISSAAASTVPMSITNILMDDAAGSQTVTVTGAGNFTLGNVRADTLTTTGVTGTVSATLTNATGGSVFSGGNGATTITGTALADQITTGSGNDIIVGLAGADRIDTGNGTNSVTSGTGNDIINLGTGVDTLFYADARTTDIDTVTNFTGGTDIISVSIGNIAGAATHTLTNMNGVSIDAALAAGGFTSVSAAVNTNTTLADATNMIVFTSAVATSFATAIGTSRLVATTGTNTGNLSAIEGIMAVWYDSVNLQNVYGYILDADNAGTRLDDLDTFVELVRITGTQISAANADLSLAAFA